MVSKDLGVKRVTLDKWISAERISNPDRIPEYRPAALQNAKVGDVRIVLRMLDEGLPLKQISRETGVDRQTMRRWRDDPRYREATLEYDADFPYDHNDILDRAVVAHHLCTLTPDPMERLDLLMAAVGSDDNLDEFDIPFRKHRNRSLA